MLRKRRPRMSVARTAAIAAAAFLLLATPFGRSALAREKLTVRLDFLPWGVHAAMHLAQTKGWFEQAGLEAEIQDGRGSNNTLQLVNAGRSMLARSSSDCCLWRDRRAPSSRRSPAGCAGPTSVSWSIAAPVSSRSRT
jgi:ABC-type nitrate/sulfonate/bicarbonate transport system substrate-binding protein